MRRVIKYVSFLMILLSISVCFLGCQKEQTTEAVKLKPYLVKGEAPLVSAHRAGALVAPENTMQAFKYYEDVNYKIDILEFDVQLTADDELVLLHDPNLDRTSNSREHFGEKKVKIRQKTYSELRELNMAENFCKDGKYPYRGLRGNDIPDDVRITKLDDVLDYLEEKQEMYYIIEVKDVMGPYMQACDKLVKILKERNILNKTFIGSFGPNVSEYLDEKYPEVCRSANTFEFFNFMNDVNDKANKPKEAYKFDLLQVPCNTKILGFMFDSSYPEFIKYAHDRGIALQYWTVNNVSDMERLIDLKVDGIITDNPDLLYKVYDKKGIKYQK